MGQLFKQILRIRNREDKIISITSNKYELHRLWNILRFIPFGNQKTWERLQNDKAAATRYLWYYSFLLQIITYCKMQTNEKIKGSDVKFFIYKEMTIFTQYISSKLAKYGSKYDE